MMKIGEHYKALVLACIDHGDPRSPRGKECNALVAQSFSWDVCPNVPKGIGFNKRFAIAELMAIIADYNSVAWLAQFNQNITQFSDDGKTFHGHYGERLSHQWGEQIDRLRRDPDTRQAVFQIWDWGLDCSFAAGGDKKDYPCNVVFQIHKGLDDEHDMSIFQRSSDLIWGLPYDHFVFGCILDLICMELGFETGKVNRFISDAHIYAPGVYYTEARIAAASKDLEWGMWTPATSYSHFLSASMEVITSWRDHKPASKLSLAAKALAKELGLCV